MQFDLNVSDNQVTEKMDKTELKKWGKYLDEVFFIALQQLTQFFNFRAPVKEKEESDLETITELLKEVDPKEYEKYARHYGITDYRQLLTHLEEMQAKEEPVHRLVNVVCTVAISVCKVNEVNTSLLLQKSVEDEAAEVRDLYKLMTRSLSISEPVKVLKDLSDISAPMGEDAKFVTELIINVPGIEINW